MFKPCCSLLDSCSIHCTWLGCSGRRRSPALNVSVHSSQHAGQGCLEVKGEREVWEGWVGAQAWTHRIPDRWFPQLPCGLMDVKVCEVFLKSLVPSPAGSPPQVAGNVSSPLRKADGGVAHQL